jgi:serine/threonine-protein kinase
MSLDAAQLARLSTLLDHALELAPAMRESWLAALTGDKAALAPTLRRLLADVGVEGAALIDRGPALVISRPRTGPTAFRAGERIGPYRLQSELGVGGMGEVWLAERADGQLKRPVALKLPMLQGRNQLLVQRFERERDILGSLVHPRIARLYDAGVSDEGQPYLAMEYVHGEPIDQYCQMRRLPVAEIMGLLLQVTEAVSHAHSRLIVHRDLKPGNVLVTSDGQVRLLDFGIAKLMEGDRTEETALTRAVGRAFTPDYASPEQIRGEPLGTASDVYSLGVLAFELLAGKRPYKLERGNAAELERAVIEQEVPPASSVASDPRLKRELRGDLDATLRKALHKAATERYPTVDALAQDWRRHLRGQRVLAQPDSLAARALRLLRSQRMPLAAAAAVAAMFVLALGFGATAVVIAALVLGLGAALWRARRAAHDRDRALALAERNDAVYMFLDMLINKAARSGEPLTAQQLLERSQQLVENELKDRPDNRATVLTMIGLALNMSGNPARARQLLERAVTAAHQGHDAELRDEVSCHYAMTLVSCGRVDDAVAILAPIAASATAPPETRAYAHYYLGEQAKARNQADALLQHASAGQHWLRAPRRSVRRLEDLMQALMGFACHLNGRNDDADFHYRRALATLEGQGLGRSPNAEAHLYNWGVIKLNTGEFEEALALFERGLALGAQAGAGSEPSAIDMGGKARALQWLGRWAEAEQAYADTLRLAQAQGLARMGYYASVGLATLRIAQGRTAEAQALLRDADAMPSGTAAAGTPSAHLRLLAEGQLALRLEDAEGALAAFDRLIDKPVPISATVLAQIGRAGALVGLARDDDSLAAVADALKLARQLQGRRVSSLLVGLAKLQAARCHEAAHRDEAARSAAAEALDHFAPGLVDHPDRLEALRLAEHQGDDESTQSNRRSASGASR